MQSNEEEGNENLNLIVMGKNNIRFRGRGGMQVPHKKITVTVKEHVLVVLSEEALVLAMPVRLLGSGVELLRRAFKDQEQPL